MAEFFFYTDPDKLNPQTFDQVFGPVSSSDNLAYEAGKDKYRITDIHTGTNAPAIAVCDGTICVQPDDRGTFSVILKPHKQPPFSFPFIKYFIYKGINKASLIKQGTNTEITDNNNITFAKRIRNEWDEDGGTNPLSNSVNVLGLNLNNTFQYNNDNSTIEIFADDQPIDNFFRFPNPDFQLPIVRGGEYLGLFNNLTIGFEIILDKPEHISEISRTRNFDNFIIVESINDPLNESNSWQVNDLLYYSHWYKKEACLKYLDPCAFFGGFINSQLSLIKGGSKSVIKDDDLFTSLLSLVYYNNNVNYLEIIGEGNFSYYLFGKYNSLLTFQDINDSSNNRKINYRRSGWPLLKILHSDIPGISQNGVYNISLIMPTGQNRYPAVYLSYGFIKNREKLKNKFLNADIDNSGTSTKPLPIAFPMLKSSNHLISNFNGLSLLELFDPFPLQQNYLFPKRTGEFDRVFNLHCFTKQINFLKNKSFLYYRTNIGVSKGNLEQLDHVANLGVFQDDTTIVLAIFPTNYNSKSSSDQLEVDWTNSYCPNEIGFLEHFFKSFPSVKLYTKQVNTGQNQDVFISELKTNSLTENNQLTDHLNLDDFHFYFLDKSKLNNLLSGVYLEYPDSEKYPIFFKASSSQLKESSDGSQNFFETTFTLQGFKININKIEAFETTQTLKSVSYANL